jgi:hypothetical protein
VSAPLRPCALIYWPASLITYGAPEWLNLLRPNTPMAQKPWDWLTLPATGQRWPGAGVTAPWSDSRCPVPADLSHRQAAVLLGSRNL